MTLAFENATSQIAAAWRDDLTDRLVEYVAIPALSPNFDPEWEANGEIERAVDHIRSWIEQREVAGMSVEVQRLPGLTPLIVVEIDAFGGAATDALKNWSPM